MLEHEDEEQEEPKASRLPFYDPTRIASDERSHKAFYTPENLQKEWAMQIDFFSMDSARWAEKCDVCPKIFAKIGPCRHTCACAEKRFYEEAEEARQRELAEFQQRWKVANTPACLLCQQRPPGLDTSAFGPICWQCYAQKLDEKKKEVK